MNTPKTTSLKVLLCLFLICCLSPLQASNRGPVIWDEANETITTDTGEAFIGVDFFIDIYDIADMKAKESDYEAYLKDLITENDANVVRIAPWMGYWEDIDSSSYWYDTHLNDLSYAIGKVVQWADELNAYAVISYGPMSDYVRANAFFDDVAVGYSSDTHVLFEVTSNPDISLSRLKLDRVDSHLANVAPNTHVIYEPTRQWERRRQADQFRKYGAITFPERVATAGAVADYIDSLVPAIDYVIETTLPATTSNRWDSVSGVALDETLSTADFDSLTFEIKAQIPQSYWVYLRDSGNNDLGAHYNTYTGDAWNTVTLNSSDFGTLGSGEIASVQFFIGNDPSYDDHSGNVFYFDNLSLSDGSVQYSEALGAVDEAGSGWTSVGYNQDSVSITRELADNPVTIGYAYKAELNVASPANRWDSVPALILENSFARDDFESISFDVKADTNQGFWVYLRNGNSKDALNHFSTYAFEEWTRITLSKSDFGESSGCTDDGDCNISELHFFIGYDASNDSTPENAFYFDNIVVTSSSGEEQGERGATDAVGTGWFEKGYGITGSIVERIEEGDNTTPPLTEVLYDIEYARIGGTDYYVSPEGNDSNDGLTIETAVLTPQVGADKLSAGDKLIVMPGEYYTPGYGTSISISESGTPDNWISIEAFEPGTAHFIVRGPYGVVADGAAYLRVKGLKISGLADTLTPDEAEALREVNWYAEGLVGVGIGTESREVDGTYYYPHHLIIEDNHIFNMSAGGIAMKRADYILIKGNLVHNNAYYNVWAPSGISVWENHNHDDATDKYRTVITGNISYGNYNYFNFYASSSPELQETVTDGNGIIIDALAIDQGYTGDGLVGIYSGRTLIENNITYNNGGRGINLYASDNIDIIHNVSYNNSQHPDIGSESVFGNVKNVRMYNNILYVDAGENTFEEYLSSNIDVSHNIIVKDGEFTDDDRLGLASDTIYDSAQFVDELNFDFNLMPSSPAIDAGTDILKSFEDINGIPRPLGGAADIGVYEQ
ncbi:choice-of-anchor Q domain-containing protein [Ningiella sp. W23]|uniref:choice-of-anchor Q domain-containing protein n=1 Tax=Ningiella sp. W23 TaxID=3023715 RepID=UPI0037570E06